MPNELLLNPFDYRPVLEIQSELSFSVGFVPSHLSISIVDENGRNFRTSCPPAMIQVKLDIADQARFGNLGAAISHTSLEIITRVMLDFRNRPWTLLRGVSYLLRAEDPPVQASFIRRLSLVLERGEPCAAQSAQLLDLSGAVEHQLERAKQFGGSGDPAFLERVEKGIHIIREAAERDAKTAMATLAGTPQDFERELSADNRDEIEDLFDSANRKPPFTEGYPVIQAAKQAAADLYVPMIDTQPDPDGQDGV